jgi:hypothetical protein
MAIYNLDPGRYGLNFLGQGIQQGTAGLLGGLLQRQDPRNIEIRRTWADPNKHMTPFGWAKGAPGQVTGEFDVVGGFIPTIDATGKPIVDPVTGQPVLKWDQRFQKKGSPIPSGYQILTDPYKQFPGTATKKENTPSPFMGLAELPPILSPLRMESGGKVPEQNSLQALITLLEIEHKKTKKGEVPAILHKGEGVVTKKGMKVLNKMVGGIDNLNSLGESLPKMGRGGEVQNTKSDRDVIWNLVKNSSGDLVWVQTQGKGDKDYPWEPYLPKQHTSGETYFLPYDPVNRNPTQYTQNPTYTPNPLLGWGDINIYGGIGPTTVKKETPPVEVNKPIEKSITSKEPVKLKNKPATVNIPQNIPIKPVSGTSKVTSATPGYRDWNAPSQFNFGQFQGIDPLQAMGMIQADVESRGVPPLQPVYGAQGQVLPQQTIAEQRIARQGELSNQYLAGLQGEAAKVQMDWYPKEAKAKIDQINSQIAYNNAMLKGGGMSGLSPEDLLKLAQIDKINADLAVQKISALESALKISDKMDKKSRKLLALEYVLTKYPILTERPPDELLSYLGKNKINILGINFDMLTPEITAQDVQLVSNKVRGVSPMPSMGQQDILGSIQQEYSTNNIVPTVPTAPGASQPVTNQLLDLQNALIKPGAIR